MKAFRNRLVLFSALTDFVSVSGCRDCYSTFCDARILRQDLTLSVWFPSVISTRGTPYATQTKRGLLSRLAVFFQDIISWEWEDVPTRPPLLHGDLPKLPTSIPRYIPQQELDPLMPAIRALDCPYQRTALLIERWCGARREEIGRLSVDCLDSYPDGTPHLRIPAGKTKCERIMPLNEEAAEAIRYLRTLRGFQRGLRDRQTGVETSYLLMRHGRLISTKYLLWNDITGLFSVSSSCSLTLVSQLRGQRQGTKGR